jgi:gas vesicle protein
MRTFNYLVSIGIAAGAGLAIGILTAPRSGKRTRAMLRDDVDETKAALNKAANKKIKEAKKQINKSVEKQLKNGKTILDNAKKDLTI